MGEGRIGTGKKSVCLGSGLRTVPSGGEGSGILEAPSCGAVPAAHSEWGCDCTISASVPSPTTGGASCSPGAGPLEASVCGLGPPHCPLPGSQAWLFLQGSESRSAAPITAPLTWEGSSGPQQLLGGGSRLRFGSSGPMKPRDRHICTQHAFLQTTESLAEMR